MQVIYHFEPRFFGVPVDRGNRAQTHEFLFILEIGADVDDLIGRDFQSQLAPVEFAASQGLGLRFSKRSYHRESFQLFCNHGSTFLVVVVEAPVKSPLLPDAEKSTKVKNNE